MKWTLKETGPLTLGVAHQGGGVVPKGRAAFHQELSLYMWTQESSKQRQESVCGGIFKDGEKDGNRDPSELLAEKTLVL